MTKYAKYSLDFLQNLVNFLPIHPLNEDLSQHWVILLTDIWRWNWYSCQNGTCNRAKKGGGSYDSAF